MEREPDGRQLGEALYFTAWYARTGRLLDLNLALLLYAAYAETVCKPSAKAIVARS